MKLPSIFKNKDTKHPMLQWPSCKNPKTQSFRAGDDIFKTTNSIYFDPLALDSSCKTTPPESCTEDRDQRACVQCAKTLTCTHENPKTQSFRAGADIFKTTNSIYFDPLALDSSYKTTPPESSTKDGDQSAFAKCAKTLTCTYENPPTGDSMERLVRGAKDGDQRAYAQCAKTLACIYENSPTGDSVERIVRGARSDRLFYDPGHGDSSSILERKPKTKARSNRILLKETIVLSMESEDPYIDFRSSMQEMVETHGLKDWESLEELLGWYLKMNGKINHGFVVGAFVDVLLGLAFSSSSSCCCSEHDSSFLSASSSFSSHPSPLLERIEMQKS